MNPRGRSLESSSKTVSGGDRAVANLLRLLGAYLQPDKCPDCEARVSEAVCGQLALIYNSPNVSPAIRDSCMELIDHWLLPPEQRGRFNGDDAQGAGKRC